MASSSPRFTSTPEPPHGSSEPADAAHPALPPWAAVIIGISVLAVVLFAFVYIWFRRPGGDPLSLATAYQAQQRPGSDSNQAQPRLNKRGFVEQRLRRLSDGALAALDEAVFQEGLEASRAELGSATTPSAAPDTTPLLSAAREADSAISGVSEYKPGHPDAGAGVGL